MFLDYNLCGIANSHLCVLSIKQRWLPIFDVIFSPDFPPALCALSSMGTYR